MWERTYGKRPSCAQCDTKKNTAQKSRKSCLRKHDGSFVKVGDFIGKGKHIPMACLGNLARGQVFLVMKGFAHSVVLALWKVEEITFHRC